MPAGEQDLPPEFNSTAPRVAEGGPPGRAAVYQGGFYLDLHRMLGVQSGSQVGLLPPLATFTSKQVHASDGLLLQRLASREACQIVASKAPGCS